MKNKQEASVTNFQMNQKGIEKDRKMLVFVEATGNGILGHVPRTRRAWPLSSKPDGILEQSNLGRPDEVLQNTNSLCSFYSPFTWAACCYSYSYSCSNAFLVFLHSWPCIFHGSSSRTSTYNSSDLTTRSPRQF